MKQILIFLLVLPFLYLSCGNNNPTLEFTVKEISVNSTNGGEPNLSVTSDGQVLLSWIEYKNDTTDVLQFSKLENNKWSDPSKIAEGSNWFVNWADFPSLRAYQDSTKYLAAHWLQKSDVGTYDYDVRISQSKDDGKTWSPPFIIHNDGIAAEHGFVSLMPISSDRMLATWLDGRNTKGHSHVSNHSHDGGAMTLRTAEFDINGNIFNEAELDEKVCDCCQTDMAMSDDGPIVVYRDRSDTEIRDISFVRKVNHTWSKPQIIAKDNWNIAGCPVNGPAIDAKGKVIAVAWYTMNEDTTKVKACFSFNSGASFEKPIEISRNNTLGRIDIRLLDDNSSAGVSWIDEEDDQALIKFRIVNSFGVSSNDYIIARTSSSRSSGFPKMVKVNNQVVFAWTQSSNERNFVKTAIVNL